MHCRVFEIIYASVWFHVYNLYSFPSILNGNVNKCSELVKKKKSWAIVGDTLHLYHSPDFHLDVDSGKQVNPLVLCLPKGMRL